MQDLFCLSPITLRKARDNYRAILQFISWYGSKEIDETYFPAYVYDMNLYDHGHTKAGLFYGYLPIRAARVILTAPSAGTNIKSSKSTRAGNAAIHNIDKITPEILAYVNVQVYVSLSSSAIWENTIGFFNLKQFYFNILRLFDGSRPNWERNVLSWWQSQIFPAAKQAAKRARKDDIGTVADFLDSDDEELAPNPDGDDNSSASENENDSNTLNSNNNNNNNNEGTGPREGEQEDEDELAGPNFAQTPAQSQTQPDSQSPVFLSQRDRARKKY